MHFSPPCAVYSVTPKGMRNAAAVRFTPDSALMTAAPPRMSMDVTMMLVMNMKTRKTRCAGVPQRACTISSAVWMAGHLRLISTASTAKRSTWMVAPEAYQKGPDTP